MDFIDEVRQLATRFQSILPHIKTEEATKHSLILPFLQLLGYNIFDPSEVVPEYTADVGTKKGEKVDYAIVLKGKPAILIEAKSHEENLDGHSSQLFRYFSVTDAKFAILTNGVIYRFYSDLQEPNRMDNEPFLIFSLMDIKEELVPEIKRFRKGSFDPDNLLSAATNLIYTTRIRSLLDTLLTEPSDDFLRLCLREVYGGKITQNVLDQFRPIVKRAFAQHINDIINERLRSAMKNVDPEVKVAASGEEQPTGEEQEDPETEKRIETTDKELEAFYIVKSILRQAVDPSRVTHKDTMSYFGVILDDNTRKWICRFFFARSQKYILIRGESERRAIDSVDDLYQIEAELLGVITELEGTGSESSAV